MALTIKSLNTTASLDDLVIASSQVKVVKRINDLETNLKLTILMVALQSLPLISYDKWRTIWNTQMSNNVL